MRMQRVNVHEADAIFGRVIQAGEAAERTTTSPPEDAPTRRKKKVYPPPPSWLGPLPSLDEPPPGAAVHWRDHARGPKSYCGIQYSGYPGYTGQQAKWDAADLEDVTCKRCQKIVRSRLIRGEPVRLTYAEDPE